MSDFGIDCTHTDDGVVEVTLRNPARRNAVRLEMWERLREVAETLHAAASVRVVVLRGHGDEAFASGADISEFQTHRKDAASGAAYESTTARTFEALLALDKPLVAMLQGFCIGGGLAIALCADLRIAADDTTLQLPAARLGLGYHMSGIERLLNVVGPAAAAEIFFTARRYTAVEAQAIGLVNRVVDKAALVEFTREYVAGIAANAPLTLRAAKRAFQELQRDPARRDVDAVRQRIAACFESADYAEGVAAFMAKRRPRFTGA